MSVKAARSAVIVLFLLLIGCSKSEDDLINEAFERAKDVFHQEERIVKVEDSSLATYYIPKNLTIKEEDDHNIILEGKDKLYVIFKNTLESPQSKRLFHLAKIEQVLLYESFEKEDMFGYIRIRPNSDGELSLYEVQVGVGGVKVTTNVTLKDIPREAEEIMKIAKSILEDTF